MRSIGSILDFDALRGEVVGNRNLIQNLPTALEEAYRGAAQSGENVVVSLAGALGEALVVTNKRVMIIRESEPYHGPDVHSYPFGSIRDVNVAPSPTGATLSISASYPVSGDEGTVYFPADSTPLLEAAASAVRSMVAGEIDGRAGGPAGAAAPVRDAACPSCGRAVGERDAFCSACGANLRDICQVCGGAMPLGSAFCPLCGSEARPAALECPACGARANPAVMSYCPQCGRALTAKCGSCGGTVVAGWARCRYCGREFGSAAGIARRAHRLSPEREEREEAGGVEPAASEESSDSLAAGHNARGAELFEQEKVQEAIEEFRRAIVLEPDNASYHTNLAVAYDEVDMDQDARREYERALELNSSEPTALLQLGYLLNESEEPERASELWRRLMQVAPGTPEAEEAAQNLSAQEAL